MAPRDPLPDPDALLRRLRAAVLATDALLDEVETRFELAPVARESVALAAEYARDPRWLRTRVAAFRRASTRAHKTISGILPSEARPWNLLATHVVWTASRLLRAEGCAGDRARRSSLEWADLYVRKQVPGDIERVFAWLGSRTPEADAARLLADAERVVG